MEQGLAACHLIDIQIFLPKKRSHGKSDEIRQEIQMPNNQALQVLYGSIPLILALVGIWLRKQMLLKDILARLGRSETVPD